MHAQCPWNRVNCSHGCGRHFDDNGDGYCDYSILELKSVAPIDTVKKTEIKTVETKKIILKDSAISLKNKTKVEPNKTNNNSESSTINTTADSNQISKATTPLVIQNSKSPNKSKPYDLISISCITLFLYGISFIMVKFKLMRKNIHRRIWNILLLITFLISCLFGFFLVVQINYQFAFDWLSTLLYWHVQIGISMTIISVIHILWHITYFKKIFSKQ